MLEPEGRDGPGLDFLEESDGPSVYEEPIGRSRWRRRLVVGVSIVAIMSLSAVPISNLIDGGRPRVADNGLEVCAFDYCVIQDAVSAVGLDLEMSRLSNLILDDAAARLVAATTRYLGIAPIAVRIEDQLGGQLGGYFDPAGPVVVIERPANVWIVLHEVAHAVAAGHGPDFQAVLIDLARWRSQFDD